MKLHMVANVGADGTIVFRPASAVKSKGGDFLALQRAVMLHAVVERARSERYQQQQQEHEEQEQLQRRNNIIDTTIRLTDSLKEFATKLLQIDAMASIELVLDATRHNQSGKNLRYVWARDQQGRVVLQLDASSLLSVDLMRAGIQKLISEAKA